MTNKIRPYFLFSILTIATLSLIILLNFANTPATYAKEPQTKQRQTQDNPQNIFVFGAGAKVCDSVDSAEIYRFGNETSHYFQFYGKSDNWYKITTDIFSTDANNVTIDTKLLLYRNLGEPPIAENDDKSPPQGSNPTPKPAEVFESEITFAATEDRYYVVEVQNLVRGGNGSYCINVAHTEPPDIADSNGPDACEFNNTIDTACEIEIAFFSDYLDQPAITIYPPAPTPTQTVLPTVIYNFSPPANQGPDLDYYKLWVKAGQNYICETYNLGLGNDTNIIFYDNNGGDFHPNLGNDDVAPGEKRSKQSVTVHYTGWLHILVNPVVEVDNAYADRYTYQFFCVNELLPEPTQKSPTEADDCEINDSFDLASACQLFLNPTNGANDIKGTLPLGTNSGTKALNFAPLTSGVRDIDHYKLWSKAGWGYVCYTEKLKNGNDTIMSMYFANNGALTPGNNPNDDYYPSNSLASRVELAASDSRTGWLIIKVEPAMEYILGNGGEFQYALTCEAHPPLGAPLENLNSPGTIWDATRAPNTSQLPPANSSTASNDLVSPAASLNNETVAVSTPTPPSVSTNEAVAVSFVALPASVPTPTVAPPTENVSFSVQIYYDANDNQIKDPDEGIANLPLYVSADPLATPLRITTTASGAVFISTETSQAYVQMVVPYLNINQQIPVNDAQDIRLRIASR